MNVQSKINKLLIAIRQQDRLYLVNKEQFLNKTSKKINTIHKIFHLMPVDEYNRLYPDAKKDESKYDYVRIEEFSSFRQEEILLKLVDIYKKVGEVDETEDDKETEAIL